jgi:hypothetical protein
VDDNSEVGLPRTPSPSSPVLFANNSNSSSSQQHQASQSSSSNNLKIPLRYQRHQSGKHYKKKFRWEEYEEEKKTGKFRPKGKYWKWENNNDNMF